MIFRLPLQEVIVLIQETLDIMQLAETGFKEWNLCPSLCVSVSLRETLLKTEPQMMIDREFYSEEVKLLICC